MKIKLILVLALASQLALAEPIQTDIPAPLANNIQKLAELLLDSHAEVLVKPWIVQAIDRKSNNPIYLSMFTVESYFGGNNWTQYLAAFESIPSIDGKPASYPLIDFMPVGGGGCRAIPKLDARVSYLESTGEWLFAIDALENTSNDSPNFPSKKTSIKLYLKDGRLIGQNTQCSGPWR